MMILLKILLIMLSWQCCNWINSSAGAFSRFLGTQVGMNWEIISTVVITHFFQLNLIWVWNLKKHAFSLCKLKSQVHSCKKVWLSFLFFLYEFFTKIIIRNVPWKIASSFSSAVLYKSLVNLLTTNVSII